jgi:hypothetical protein
MKTKKMLAILVLALGLITSVANADFIFGTPINLGPTVNSSSHDGAMSISADGLSIFFDSNRSGGHGDFDIWVTSRATTDDDWETPVNLGSPVNTSAWDGVASISADGLSLYFSSSRPGGYGDLEIWFTTRATTNDPWGEPVNLGSTVNSPDWDWVPSISADELTLFFSSLRPGGSGDWDLWVTSRATKDNDWSIPLNLGPTVNSPSRDWLPSISADGLTLFFTSNRLGGYGSRDIWMTRRTTTNDLWGEPVNLGPPFNTSSMDQVPIISPDGSTLYFNSNRSGGYSGLDIWQVSIEPIVDLNEDGMVDAADMCIIVDNWHTDNTLCDIAPLPFGDGFVDVKDLIVLAEHLFEDIGGEDLGGTVIERRISAGSDDAEEALNTGFTNWNYSSDLELVHDRIDNGGSQLIGMTFRDIDIAPGEVISNAYIEFVCDEIINGTADAYFLIWGHLTPNSEGFIAPYVISNRPKTEAKVSWEPDPWDAGGQRIQTVNIASIIQELIDQEGWVAGNAVEIIIGEDPSKPAFTGVRCAESYDGSASNAPLLHIEIDVP